MSTAPAIPATAQRRAERGAKRRRRLALLRQHRWIYFLMLPALLFFVLFRYAPMYGVIIAFKDFNPFGGPQEIFFGGTFAGFKYFQRLFSGYYFLPVLRNTISISLQQLVLGFPAPIILALLLNEVRVQGFKRTVQTISYLPHFLSWVVVYSLTYALLSPTNGLVNLLIKSGGGQPIHFLAEPGMFQAIIVATTIWHATGWGSILYLAAMSNIDPNLYEAARIDGASKLQEVWNITIPGILPVIIIIFILRMGRILDVGFDHILAFYSPAVYSTGDIIDTYVYREGLINFNYSYAAAAGMFKSVIALALVVGANRLSKRWGEAGLW